MHSFLLELISNCKLRLRIINGVPRSKPQNNLQNFNKTMKKIFQDQFIYPRPKTGPVLPVGRPARVTSTPYGVDLRCRLEVF